MNEHGVVLEMLGRLQASFASGTSEEWQVEPGECLVIMKRILADWTTGATETTRGRRFVRVAGQSGSGKTTQLVPAVETWFGEDRPILVAAKRIAEYHPYRDEILLKHGEEGLRRETDGFSAAMMFLLLKELLMGGYDIILDLALVEPKLEQILIRWLKEDEYDFWMTMMVVSPSLSRKWLDGRSWRHAEAVEKRFLAATEGTLGLYAELCPEMRMVMWSAWGTNPIYDGAASGAPKIWRENIGKNEALEGPSVEELARAKKEYFRNKR